VIQPPTITRKVSIMTVQELRGVLDRTSGDLEVEMTVRLSGTLNKVDSWSCGICVDGSGNKRFVFHGDIVRYTDYEKGIIPQNNNR
jgi:hypothetical protein